VFVPAIASNYSALQVLRLFRSFTDAESVRATRILSSLHAFNTPLVIGLGVGALLAFVIALVLATDPKRRLASVGWPLSIAVPVLAVTPGLLLWLAESTTIDVITGKHIGTPAEVAETISRFLFWSLAAGLIVQGVTVVCAVISLFIPTRSRSDALSVRRAFPWAITGIVLLIFAVAFFFLV
jgi:hypothetical protein